MTGYKNSTFGNNHNIQKLFQPGTSKDARTYWRKFEEKQDTF